MNSAIGKTIFELRRSRHWTMQDLGERVGLNHSGISRREAGDHTRWGDDERTRFAEAFDMTLEEFDTQCQEMTNQLTNRSPSAEDQRHDQWKRAVTPTNERIMKLKDMLSDELAPKVLFRELNEIARKHGLQTYPDE